MSEALGMSRDDAAFLEAFTEGQREETHLRGLAGALERHQQRAEHVVFPRQRDDDQTPPVLAEPTGQHAVVVNAADEVFVRLEHRWYQAGGASVDPILWPKIHAVRIVSWGES